MIARPKDPFQRANRSHRCPVCGGASGDRRGQGKRCWGMAGAHVAYCTREQHGGDAPFDASKQAYYHRLDRACACGRDHGGAAVPSFLPTSDASRDPLPPPLRHAVLERYLAGLPWRAEHEAVLHARGQADVLAARRLGYRSLPTRATACDLLAALLDEFGPAVVRRMPGVFMHDNGDLWTYHRARHEDAIVIPCRDERGRLTGLVRLTTHGDGAKYRTYAGCSGLYSVAGQPWTPASRRALFVVEGIHKAHVVAQYGPRVLGLPGLFLGEEPLAAIGALAPDVVVLAYDMDRDTNPDVARALRAAQEALWRRRVTTLVACWSGAKGLDDALAIGATITLKETA